jgi:hypothetical protein
MIRAIHMRFHVRFECLRRLVHCRFDCCSAMFPCEERETHELNDCVLAQSRAKIMQHAIPQNTIINCSSCSQPIKVRDLERHRTALVSAIIDCFLIV